MLFFIIAKLTTQNSAAQSKESLKDAGKSIADNFMIGNT